MSRILLADDSPHAQRMGERILRDEGHTVVTVTDGETALLRLKDVNPDLILVDVGMPNVSGYQICEFVKNSGERQPARVILTLGALKTLDEAEMARVKADGVMRKPFEASALLAAARMTPARVHEAKPGEASAPKSVVVLDAEQIRAAVTVALDAAMPALVDQITDKVMIALAVRPTARTAKPGA